MEDDRKLCEYSLPEGTTISALFEPDVDINIEVSTRHQTQKLTVSNATSVMALEVQICKVFKCSISPEKLELRLGDVALEDPMPLHFYGIVDGSRLDVVKPYVRVTMENNHGDLICWHLDRKDTIKEVKVKLVASLKKVSTKQMHLYLVSDGQNFDELDDDDETVENYEIKNGDRLYLPIYKWLLCSYDVKMMKTWMKVSGLEKDDTCLVIRLKAQDQTGMPFSTIRLVRLVEYGREEDCMGNTYYGRYKRLTVISDDEIPFSKKAVNKKVPPSIVTEEELKEDATRVEAEKKAWLEKIRKREEER